MDSTTEFSVRTVIQHRSSKFRQRICVGMAMAIVLLDLIQQQRHRQSHLEQVNTNQNHNFDYIHAVDKINLNSSDIT